MKTVEPVKTIAVKVTYSNGNHLITEINATIEEAREYYFSFDRVEEVNGKEIVTRCVSVEEIK